MRRQTAAGLALLLLSTAGASAAPAAWQWEAGVTSEQASGGGADRSQIDLALRRRLGAGTLIEGNARHTRRGSVSDQELGAGFVLPLGAQWSLAAGATASPSHHVLARTGARTEIAYRFGAGWVATAGATRRLHDGGGNASVWLGVERYVDVWRVAAAVSRVRLDGGASQAGARLQLDRYFADERGRWGVLVARGRELESLPETAPPDVLDQRVTTLALVATWPLAKAWAITADLAHVRYDDLRRRSSLPAPAPFQRTGLRLGVRHDF